MKIKWIRYQIVNSQKRQTDRHRDIEFAIREKKRRQVANKIINIDVL